MINTSLTSLNLDGDEKIGEMTIMKKEIMNRCTDNNISEETRKLLGI